MEKTSTNEEILALPRWFSYKEVWKATCGFKEKMGNGSFGTVFKGALTLAGGETIAVAVKRPKNMVEEGEWKFQTEMRSVGRIHQNLCNNYGTSRRRHIEGPMHVLSGHLGEVVYCSVSSDLGILTSCFRYFVVLVHSLRKGRVLRKLDVKDANAVCLSSQGVIMIWIKMERKIETYTVNGIPIATSVLSPFVGIVSCIEIFVDGENAIACTSSSRIDILKDSESSTDGFRLEERPDFEEIMSHTITNEETENRPVLPVPSIIFVNLHSLKVFHTLVLGEGQDVTAITLNKDNTNL